MERGDRVVLLTGGAQRVGAAIARHLHAQGLALALHYRSSVAAARALQAELEAIRPHSCVLLPADLLDSDAPKRLVQGTLDAYGRLDMLVNNASSFYPTPLLNASADHWEDLLGTNVKAPFFLIQAAASFLTAARGAVVNIVDIHADRPLKGYPLYSVGKAALVMLTKALAVELAPCVRVNAVAPGTILWPESGISLEQQSSILAQVPQKRSGTPEDIAHAVRFFLLEAPYITGQVLAIDGGRSVVL